MQRRTLLAGVAAATTTYGLPALAVPTGALGRGPVAFRLQARARTERPHVTFGQAFARGDVPAGSLVALLGAGGVRIPVQQDQENRWPDGSLRFAALSFVAPQSFAAHQTTTYELAAEPGTPSRGGLTPAQLAQATDFKLKVSGYAYGADTFTVSINEVLATLPAWHKDKGWGRDPLGGWEVVREGPICTEWRVWRMLKRDSDGASHRWVKAVLYVRAWGANGPYEVLPSLRQSNSYGPHPAGTVGDTGPQHGYTGIAELWNGSARLYAWGGANDQRTVSVPAGVFDCAHSCLTEAAGFAFWGWAFGFAVAGPGAPSSIPRDKAFWVTRASPDGHGPGFATFRADVNSSPGDRSFAPWRPHTTLGPNSKLTFPDGSVRYTAKGGMTGATPPTSNAVGVRDGTVAWDITVILSFGRQGEGHASIMPVIGTFPGSNVVLATVRGDPIWVGAGAAATRPEILIAHDAAYLTRRARFLPPYDLTLNVQPDAKESAFYGPNNPSIYSDNTGDDPGDERIGYLSQSQAQLLLSPLDPARETACKSLALSFLDFPGTWEDERTGRPVACTERHYPGLIANSGFALGDWTGKWGDPSWQGLGAGLNTYQGIYRPLMDGSHLPALWITPYLKTGHPAYSELGLNQAMAMLASEWPGEVRDPTIAGRKYQNIVLGPHCQQVRGMGWALRILGLLDSSMPDTDPLRALIRDAMDDNAAYATAFPPLVDPRVTRLGCLYEPTTDLQFISMFFYHILATCLAAEIWRGDREGWAPLLDAVSHATVGYWDEAQGGSGYYADSYHLVWTTTPDHGNPAGAYPSIQAMMRANFPKAPPRPDGLFMDAGGGVPLDGAGLAARGIAQGEASFPGDTTTLVAFALGALGAQAAAGVPRAREAYAALRRRLVTPPLRGLPFTGSIGGQPAAFPAWAIVSA
jgi:hypothetical protein